MGDTAVAATEQAPSSPVAPQSPPASRGAARAERRAAAISRLQASGATTGIAPAAPAPEAPKPADPPPAPEKPAEPEKPDPAAERGLRAVEQAKKKWLDEQNAAKAELEVQRAEVARLRKEAEGKITSRDELKKLSPTELLEALDHFTEDDHDILSRAAYARTKAGKTDPRAQAAAQEASRAQGSKAAQAELAELRETVKQLEAKLTGEFTRRDQASFAEHWVGEAVKAIPADKPSYPSRLQANDPKAAKRELLLVGAELEKANDGQAPSYDEVIAELDKRDRAWLKSRGFDPDALLAPPKPVAPEAPKPAPARTLDPTASNLTRPENAPKTRDERRAAAVARLRASQRTTADQT